MKNLLFPAICGVVLFVLLFTTACSNNVKNNIVEDNGIVYATDPLDVEITKMEKNETNLFSIRGEETIEETDGGFVRRCPVKFINSETGAVKDTVFVFTENY